MQIPDYMMLRADWSGREDTPLEQADMVAQCLQGLIGLGGMFDKPWYARHVGQPNQPINPTSVREDVAETLAATKTSFFLYTQEEQAETPCQDAYAWLWISVSGSVDPEYLEGLPDWAHPIINSVILHIEQGSGAEGQIPFKWIVGHGPELVKLFVDVWRPEAVRLTEPDLQGYFDPDEEEWAWASPSYHMWLAESILSQNQMPDAPYRQAFQNGAIVGVDPSETDPREVAENQIDWDPIYACNDNPLEG